MHAEEAAGGIRPAEESPGLLRSRLTPPYLGDRSKKKWEGGSKESNSMRKGRKEGSAMGSHHIE